MAFKSVFDPDFNYRNADSTDVRKTFIRIRREQRLVQRPVQSEDASAKVIARIGPAVEGAPAAT